MMNIIIREAEKEDLPELIRIWNEVVEDGMAFPQKDLLDEKTGSEFFSSMYTAAAVADGKVVGLYILHPNNIGRIGHIANASYAVDRNIRGQHIGEKLVLDCLKQGSLLGFRILQFNAVVATNVHAIHLYERLGFQKLGVIPGGYFMDDGHYEDIILYYHLLKKE